MKIKHIIPILITAAVALFACTQEYDDSVLKAKVDALSSQVAKLAEQVNELNTQVQGFKEVIDQWKAGGFVESIQDVTGGKTITFVGGKTVTIYDGTNGTNGKDGKDGADGTSPVIGIKADTDGTQYWTVDGEFLLVGGNKVPVAVIPVFSTNENGELIVTVNGAHTNLGKVSAAGDAIFESVVADADKVTFTLVGGQSFEIPFVKAFKVVIDKIAYTEVKAGDVLAIPYTVKGSDNATVMAFAGGAYKAVVDAEQKKVNVTVPNPAADGQVMVWAQTEEVVSPFIILNFTVEAGQGGGETTPEVVIVSQPEVYNSIPLAGGEVNVDLTSNVDIVVAAPTVDWVSAVLATKADYTLTLTLQENTGADPRSTTIKINRADNGETVQNINIVQLGTGSGSGDTPGQETLTWDFSTQAWQTAFAGYGDAGTDITNWNLTLDGFTVYSSNKSKYSATYFQFGGGSGDPVTRYFQFTASAEGKLKVTVSNTGSSEALDRTVKVAVGNYSDAKPAGFASTAPQVVEFSIPSGDVQITAPVNGLRFYKFEFVPGEGGGSEPGDDPGDDPVPGESADLTCPTPPTVGTVDPTQMVGYAAAKGVTGGAGAGSKTYHFNNGKALQTWLLQRTKDEKKGDHTPVTIWLSGTFTDTDGRDFSSGHPWFDVKDVSNLSFIGTDSFVMDRIGIFCVRASNIIIRNINFQQPKANNGADAVSMQECDGVWVDHCTFTSLNQTKDYEDGSTDVTHGSKNVTVSWCRYIKTQKSCLVGHSNSQSSDSEISVTFHHNWFDQSSSRHPRVRFGKAHVYNNLYDGCTTYGAGSAYGAMVLVEYNYFDGVQLPTDICTYPAKESNESNLQGSVAGYLYPTQNVYVNRPEKAKDPYPLSNVQYTKYNGSTITPLTYADFQPSYDYTVTAAEDVPALVKANAGYGKMTGFAEAPIPVDNAGINDFNGTDDDPVDPDQGDEDDPVGPTEPETGNHVHVVYYNTGSEKTILTDGAPSNYFDATAKTDLSSYAVKSWELEGYSSNRGIKMNSSGYVKFTTSATLNSTVRFYAIQKTAGSAKLQLVPTGGEAQEFSSGYDTIGDSGVIALEKGTEYTIKQVSSEQALLLVVVRETE